MRSSVADYQVIRALPSTGAGQARYFCHPPERLDLDGTQVMITELAVDASGWRDLAVTLSRLSGVGSPHLLALIEVGPDLDPDGSGVYLVSESTPGGSLAHPSTRLDPAAQMRAVIGRGTRRPRPARGRHRPRVD